MSTAADAVSREVEMALRLLPGVIGVWGAGREGTGDLCVLVAERSDRLASSAERVASERAPGIRVSLIEIEPFEGAPPPAAAAGHAPAERVALEHVAFDRAGGTADVVLSLGALRAKGSATGTPLISAVLATLDALRALGLAVPFSLAAVDYLGMAPDAPVVVCLRPEPRGEERMGVARSGDDSEAASRATLSALNRHLSDPLGSADTDPLTTR